MHRLLCLGQLSLVDAQGQPVTHAAAQPRRLALLALLGRSAPRAVSRERMIGWFWPDADEERGRRSLNQALYALRTELGAEDVLLGQREVRLNLDLLSCDVADFEHALESGRPEEAAALYRGPFADGFHLPSSPEFEQWLEDERRTLAQRHIDVLESLATTTEARGDAAAAVGWWRKAANADPASARLAVSLMRALAAAGDRTGAVRHATIYETIVRQQLDLPPDPAVLALAEELKRAPVVTAPAPRLPAAAPAPARPTPVPEPAPASAGTVPAVAPVRYASRAPWRLALWAAAPLVIAATAFLAWQSGRATSAPGDGPPVVAVVPLDNATGDSTYNLVGAMVTDWVTQCLAETGLVRVMDTRTMLTASSGNIRDLAAETGARYLVLGSFYLRNDSLEFRTTITDAGNGQVIAAIEPLRVSRREPTQALAELEERVTGALAVQVDRRLSNYTATASHPPTWAAYSEFLLGMRDFGRNRAYDANFLHFQRAAQLDSTYWQARLWAGISLANARRYPEADSVFREVAARRNELAPYDRAALDYFYHGFVLGDRETAYRGARAMVELAPRAGHSNWALGNTARSTRRFRESLEAYGRINLRVGWGAEWAVRILGESARSRHSLGEHEAELALARQMLARAPDDGWARTTEVLALAALKRYPELANRVEAAVVLPEDPGTWDPFSPGNLLWKVAQELEVHGAPVDSARRYGRAAIDWYAIPTAAGQDDTVHLLGHARALYAARRWADARQLYQQLVAANPESPEFISGLGASSARLGDTTAALENLNRLQNLTIAYHFGRPARWAANIAAALGRRDDAVRLMSQSIREGTGRFEEWHAHTDFLTLLDYRPFRDLLAPRR